MATNLALDDKLIAEAQKAGRHRTKKDAVTAALAEYVKRHKQQRILEAFGSFPDGGEHGVSLSEAALHEKMRRWRTPTASSSQASWDGR